MDVVKLSTEQKNKQTENIDTLDTIDVLKLINDNDIEVPFMVKEALPDIARLVDALYPSMEDGGRLIYCGAGTSGRIGLLDAVECPPTYGVESNKVICLMAGGESAFSYAKEGAEDDRDQAIKDFLSINPTNKDFLVGLAASGRTPYVVSMIEYAKSIGVKTGCIVNAKDSELSKIVDYKIEAITNSEVIAGSTRMKAGTAQKLICNMISTTVMIKLGHVYKNYMIDLRATNEKLVARQLNIITSVCDISIDDAKDELKEYGSVKLVILHNLTKINDKEELERLLNNNHNSISKVLESLK